MSDLLSRRARDIAHFLHRWIAQCCDPFQVLQAFPGFAWYFYEWTKYSRIEDAEPIRMLNTHPCLHDRKKNQTLGGHYFYQSIWAFSRISASGIKQHVDVGSLIEYVGFLTTVTNVTSVDIRPLRANLGRLETIEGSILSMPFDSETVLSLSCLHVAEHIGLGRYGDALDPKGTVKACRELSRILAKGGRLYFSLPVGEPRLCFNAHRIHSPRQILEYFESLQLVEFSCVDDSGVFHEKVSPDLVEGSRYACGLYLLTKT